MKAITRDEAATLIAHWRRMPDDADVQSVKGILETAIAKSGIDATFDISLAPHCDSLGYCGIEAVLRMDNPPKAVRTPCGDLIKDFTKVTICFDKCAGLYDYAAYGKRKEEENNLFKTLPKEEAKAVIDALPWDAEVVDFSARTNGHIRGYRHRTFYPYEGRGHYDYAGSEWEGLADSLCEYLTCVAIETGCRKHDKYAANRSAA